MTRQERIEAAKLRMSIGMRPKHQDWYEGMFDDAEQELHAALNLPLDAPYPQFCHHPEKCAGKGCCPRDPACCE